MPIARWRTAGCGSQVKFSPQQLSEVAPKRALSASGRVYRDQYVVVSRSAGGDLRTREHVVDPLLGHAVKTGTSKDMRDNWCVGFSDKYTVGVWAGNFSGEADVECIGCSRRGAGCGKR